VAVVQDTADLSKMKMIAVVVQVIAALLMKKMKMKILKMTICN
jgi:hypothetical protein